MGPIPSLEEHPKERIGLRTVINKKHGRKGDRLSKSMYLEPLNIPAMCVSPTKQKQRSVKVILCLFRVLHITDG